MYFKVFLRHNPATGKQEHYYRLVESYRNLEDRVCHRTMLNVGFISNQLTAEQLTVIQKILTQKAAGVATIDFAEYHDSMINEYVERWYALMLTKGKIEVPGNAAIFNQYQTVDTASIKSKDVREAGAEWLCLQALKQLGIDSFLEETRWSKEQIQLALTQIVSRAVYPASEYKTARWIKDNSGICELTGYAIDKITKDKLYGSALKLYSIKEALENYLSKKTNELFDIQDKIVLYDLTNTYFEGEKRNSVLAKFGRSKEKRNDAKLIVLALVVNPEGFIKYSSIYEGNMSDCKTVAGMIDKLRINTSNSAKKALVVIDAGIATEDNLKMLREKGYDYLCVTRSKLKQYSIASGTAVKTIYNKKGQKIELQQAQRSDDGDFYLKVKSDAKTIKEQSIATRFQTRFGEALQKVVSSLNKKSGIKTLEKVHQRIGRIKQKYPSTQKYYEIEVKADKNRIVREVTWKIKEHTDPQSEWGVYFLRTSLNINDEQIVWEIYNTIREIESSFRCLKTDLDLRPIYHQKDASTMAHLHLGLMAYTMVNTIRYQLKSKSINDSWQEIVRIGNTQKLVTTSFENIHKQTIEIRKIAEPGPKIRQLYEALNYTLYPFKRKKFVVHKEAPKKSQTQYSKEFNST
ncbi:MAG TPA: IS1634 family transposase [Ginsengibacter sp.]|nr:IS1634 family transposase [Ginsengibacter sp.]